MDVSNLQELQYFRFTNLSNACLTDGMDSMFGVVVPLTYESCARGADGIGAAGVVVGRRVSPIDAVGTAPLRSLSTGAGVPVGVDFAEGAGAIA